MNNPESILATLDTLADKDYPVTENVTRAISEDAARLIRVLMAGLKEARAEASRVSGKCIEVTKAFHERARAAEAEWDEYKTRQFDGKNAEDLARQMLSLVSDTEGDERDVIGALVPALRAAMDLGRAVALDEMTKALMHDHEADSSACTDACALVVNAASRPGGA